MQRHISDHGRTVGKLLVVGLTAILLSTLSLGCGAAGGSPADAGRGGDGSPSCNPVAILKNCHLGCHFGSFQPPDLTDDPIATNMIGVPAGALSDPCTGMPLINLTNRPASVLLKKIGGSSCGPQMPLSLAPLAPADIACITDWVMHL